MYLHKHISANNVVIDNFPFQREIAMEAYLIENPTVLSMETDGFNDVEILKCEVTLLDGRIDKNSDGRIDILALEIWTRISCGCRVKIGRIDRNSLDTIRKLFKRETTNTSKVPRHLGPDS